MKILSLENLSESVELLKKGGTIIFPTETSYGLGCDATNQKVVDRIFKIKNRILNKSLLIIVPTIAAAKKYLVWNDLLEKTSQKYWPGSLTVVGEYKKSKSFWWKIFGKKLARGVVSEKNTLAVRVTGDSWLRDITTQFGRPIVATSANVAGLGDVYNSDDVTKMFNDQVVQPDVLVAAGALPKNLPTTVVSVLNNELKILRQGQIKIEL